MTAGVWHTGSRSTAGEYPWEYPWEYRGAVPLGVPLGVEYRWCVAHREQVYRGVGEQRVHVFRRRAEPPAVAGRRCGRCVLP